MEAITEINDVCKVTNAVIKVVTTEIRMSITPQVPQSWGQYHFCLVLFNVVDVVESNSMVFKALPVYGHQNNDV